MMPHHGYLVVEGPHDTEFLARLLGMWGMHRVQNIRDLEEFWHPIVPRTFPYQGDLLRRVPVPVFLRNQTHSIAIHSASGHTRIPQTLQETSVSLREPLNSIGIFLDADTQDSINQRFTDLSNEITGFGLETPPSPGEVTNSVPSLGIYIFPDNQNPGTLEDLLLEAGEVNYPALRAAAVKYVDQHPDLELDQRDLEEIQRPAGRNKAYLASMTGILKPGKAVQTSIQDNRWLEGKALKLRRIQAVLAFLRGLLDLP